MTIKKKEKVMTVEKVKVLIDKEQFDYGTTWSEDKLIKEFDITKPDLIGSVDTILKRVKEYELKKMNAYCMINDQLLSSGMCFVQDGGVYRVPLISEMTAHISKYYDSSNRKFKRAEKLRKSFSTRNPVEVRLIDTEVQRTHAIRNASKPYAAMA
jgi:hypothetical protein